jgi:type IV fimbrial biogenesis protein FimT
MHQKGFSLLELLAVIAIISIMVYLVFPSQQQQVARTQADILKTQLLTSIHYAQQQSQSRGESITLCALEDNHTCGTNWNNGQLIFIDKAGKGRVANENDVLSITHTSQVKGKLALQSARKLDYLTFSSIEDETNNGTFSFYAANQQKPEWKIIISENGRARIE